MTGSRIVGIVVAVAGIALLVVGLNSSQAPVDQVTETLTGRYTHSTMVYLIVGIVAIVGGGLLAFSGRRA
jgi:drug/metabolite transporter (DMT)-like permease